MLNLNYFAFPLFQNRLPVPNKCLIAATCRSSSADEATYRHDVSQQFVASCVSAMQAIYDGDGKDDAK